MSDEERKEMLRAEAERIAAIDEDRREKLAIMADLNGSSDQLDRIEGMLLDILDRMHRAGNLDRETQAYRDKVSFLGWQSYFAEQRQAEQAERSRAIVERGVRDRELNKAYDEMVSGMRPPKRRRWWRMPWLSD